MNNIILNYRSLLAALLLFGGGGLAADAIAQQQESPAAESVQSMEAPTAEQLADPEWIAQGKARFVQVCAYCHGQEGDSGKARPFRERHTWDAQFIFDTISNGRQRGANIMPAWKGSISDDMIWKIVAYIRSLEGKPKQP